MFKKKQQNNEYLVSISYTYFSRSDRGGTRREYASPTKGSGADFFKILNGTSIDVNVQHLILFHYFLHLCEFFKWSSKCLNSVHFHW